MLSGILRKMDGLLSQAWWTPLPSRCSPETITRNRGRREGLDLMLSTHRCNVLEYDLGGRDARAHPLLFHPCSGLITSDYCGANVYILILVWPHPFATELIEAKRSLLILTLLSDFNENVQVGEESYLSLRVTYLTNCKRHYDTRLLSIQLPHPYTNPHAICYWINDNMIVRIELERSPDIKGISRELFVVTRAFASRNPCGVPAIQS